MWQIAFSVLAVSSRNVFFASPDIALSIPIHYRGCSSAIACHIRRISDESAHDMQELETASSLRVVVTTDEAVFLWWKQPVGM